MFDVTNTNLPKLVTFAEFNESSRPREGERLVKVCYRVDSKTKKKLHESVCLSLTPVTAEDVKANIDKLLPLFLESIQDQQDKIARKLYEAGNTSVSTTQLSIDAVAEFLEESIYESRLTKEIIETWFDVTLADKLSSAILSKHEGIGITEDRLLAIMTEYKSKFSALAGGRTSYETPIATALVKVFDLIPESEDTLTVRLFTRLSDMLTKKKSTSDMLSML